MSPTRPVRAKALNPQKLRNVEKLFSEWQIVARWFFSEYVPW